MYTRRLCNVGLINLTSFPAFTVDKILTRFSSHPWMWNSFVHTHVHTLTPSHSHILTPLQQFCVLHLHHRISPRWEWCSSCDSAHMTRHHRHRRLREQKNRKLLRPKFLRSSALEVHYLLLCCLDVVPDHFQYCVWHYNRSNTCDGWDPRMTPIQLLRKLLRWTCRNHWLSYV